MASAHINILLADDDSDDCMFFREALKELPFHTAVQTVSDGEELMNLLADTTHRLPDILFLDLNMPRKNGFECLAELKADVRLKNLPVVICSTSFDSRVVNMLYENGALYYVRKPGDFQKLKKAIFETLTAISQNKALSSGKDNFIIQV